MTLPNSSFFAPFVNVYSCPVPYSAESEEGLRYQLGLHETYGKEARGDHEPSVRPIELYMCSVVRKMGYGDGMLGFILSTSHSLLTKYPLYLFLGFKWLAQFL